MTGTRPSRRDFLRLAGAAAAAGPAWLASAASRTAARPNIIVILVDDLGYSDLGCYGGEIDTPVIDGLGDQGIRFSQFYNTGKCCPTRTTLLSGHYLDVAGRGIRRGVTLQETLKAAGYETMAVGKWHLNGRPWERGFDRYFGHLGGCTHYFRGDKRRHKVISRRGAYHGVTGSALSALGTVLPMRQIMEPLAPGTIFVESPYCYRCPLHLTYPECDVACARDIARVIEFEDPGQISAFIGEPIQQGFGALCPVKEYWKIIREICDAYGILLIVDEVICGFGRTGKWFGIQHFDIQPDIITMAKGISSGYVPLGGVGCSDEVMEPIRVFQHIHTYGNHPVGCAAALKNIEILKEDDLIENSRRMGSFFLEGLKSLEPHPIVGDVRGTGLWAGIDLTTDKKSRAAFPFDRLANLVSRAKGKGLIIKYVGAQALEFSPPLIIQKEQIEKAVEILDECLTEEEKDMGL